MSRFSDEAARDALIGAKTEAIVRKLKRLLPGLDPTPEFAWAGAFGATATGLPIIRRLPRRPRIHAVMGYGGNGITFSPDRIGDHRDGTRRGCTIGMPVCSRARG